MPAPIKHVVVLMLENRSFDCMLGGLKPGDPGFDGLEGGESNPDPASGQPVHSWTRPGSDAATLSIPTPDPGELFAEDMNVQIFGPGRTAGGAATMAGFVANYAAQKSVIDAHADIGAVMHYFTPDQVPVLSALATAFGVSDRWHASAPCQTWPNRFFVHTGTAGGYVNNGPPHFPYTMKSVFELLSEKGLPWRIYFHDIPQSATLASVWEAGAGNFRLFEAAFVSDAMAGKLPAYSFIEPRYFANGILQAMPNDQHPPHNIHYGEQLIATVYNALRQGPGWKDTLLIVTYDEHGGNYDHVAPPPAVSPDALRHDGFAFDRYGVRVPAVIVSPYVPAGSIVRPDAGSPHPFDHTSIIATLRKIFDLAGPLTARDAVAPDLLTALTLEAPSNAGPERLAAPDLQAVPEEIAGALQTPLNGHQAALTSLAAHLPAAAAEAEAHIAALNQQVITPAAPILPTVATAASFVEAKVKAFLGIG